MRNHSCSALAACAVVLAGSSDALAQGDPFPGESGIVLPDAGSRLVLEGFSGFPTNEITVQMWIREPVERTAALFSYATDATDNEFMLFDVSSVEAYVGGFQFSTPDDVDGPGSGTWAHLTVSYRHEFPTGITNFYINGGDGPTRQVAGGPASVLQDGGCLILGEEQDDVCGGFSQSQAFLGEYKDVRIWNRALSLAEIETNYDQRLAGDEPGLVAYWPLNEGLGFWAIDQVGGNHLRFEGNAAWLPSDGPVTDSGGFSYQGLLKDDGSPFTGDADLRVGLFDAEAGGTALSTVTLDAVPVAGGLFNTTLDFGDGFFDGSPRWLEIEVQLPSGSGYETLTPRQSIGWSPQSVFSFGGAGGAAGPGGPGSIWTEGALGLFYLDRPLGVGTVSPGARLGVESVGIPAGRFTAIDAPAGEFFSYGDAPVALDSTNSGSGTTIGIRGSTNALFGTGVYGRATSTSGSTYGVYGSTASANGFGVFSNGRLGASGTKSFMIDHPLDPENALLYHYSTESPTPQNAYNGTVTLGADGSAWVTLPDYFESINTNYTYQVAAIGAPATLYIAREIENGAFLVAGGRPGMRVSWEVKADRTDRFVERYGAPTEQMKAPEHRGKYLRPELYDRPASEAMVSEPEPTSENGERE